MERLERSADLSTTGAGPDRVVWRAWGRGTPLVLLHGAAGSWSHWVRNVAALSRQHRVLAPDLPGFGDSALPPHLASAEELAERTWAALDEILPPPTPLDLAGFSFGGIVAGLVAARRPRRVGTLFLVGAGGLGVPMGPAEGLQRIPPGATPAQVADTHRANLAAAMFGDPGNIDELAVRLDVDNGRRARFRIGAIPASDVLAGALPAIDAPIVAVYGERDAFALGDLGARARVLAAGRPSTEFHAVEGAGHWVNYEAAARVDALLLDRLARPS